MAATSGSVTLSHSSSEDDDWGGGGTGRIRYAGSLAMVGEEEGEGQPLYLTASVSAPALVPRLTNDEEGEHEETRLVTETQPATLQPSNSICSEDSQSLPLCRICQQTEMKRDPLISACRCTGTLQFAHMTCLSKWIDIVRHKCAQPARCELCHYTYRYEMKLKTSDWLIPAVTNADKLLHTIFCLSLLTMIVTAGLTIASFQKDDQGRRLYIRQTMMTTGEAITLAAGILFFLAFFVAMYVQLKASRSVYHLVLKCLDLNQDYHIENYDKLKDPDRMTVV